MEEAEIRAAGGVVLRPGADSAPEVLLVHRPRYGDWSLPKGRLDSGESFEDAALREVEEETGLACRLGASLGETRYRDRAGRPKVVRYWLMEPKAGAEPALETDDEVDEVQWVPIDRVGEWLTYAIDRDVTRRAAEAAPGSDR